MVFMTFVRENRFRIVYTIPFFFLRNISISQWKRRQIVSVVVEFMIWARFKQSKLFLFCKLKCPKLDSCREFSSRFHFTRNSVTFGENVNIWTKESLNNHSLFYQIGFSRLNANEKKNHENNSLTDFKQFKW